MTRRITAGLVILGLSAALTGCVKPNTFNPYAAPEKNELNRLQTIIDDRPDLATATRQLMDLDRQIRSAYSRYAPQSVLPPSTPSPDRGCSDPFGHNTGDTYTIDRVVAKPAPTEEQWQQIKAELQPILAAAGFTPNYPPGASQPSDILNVRSGDGGMIEISGGGLIYHATTGCRPITK